MAISTNVYRNKQDELERLYKDMYNSAMRYGDRYGADRIYDEYVMKRKELEMQDIYGTANQIGGSILGLANTTGIADQYQQALMNQQVYSQASMNQAAQNIAKETFNPEFGVLYLHGKEMPADWAGAKITEFQRRVDTRYWHIQFSSKWDKALEINLYLSVDEHNGKEINEMARTYIEALNQRRVG